MKSIKFSEDYEKLPENWDFTHCQLMAVVPMKTDYIKNALPAFWRYDTKVRGEDKFFPLTFNNALVLIFLHYNTGRLFPTIRRDYPEKRKYYESSIGETFQMVKT